MTTKSMFLGFGLLLLGACAAENLGDSSAAVSGVGDSCVKDSDCPNNLECEHGACAPHGGNDKGDAGVDDHGDDGDGHDVGDDHGDDHGHDGDAGHDVGDDHGNDGDAGHDVGDDHGNDGDAGHHGHHGGDD